MMSGSRFASTLAALPLLLVAGIVPAEGAIAILADGRTLEIIAWEVDDERARLELPGGGRIEIVASRLERIVETEAPAGESAPAEIPLPAPPEDLFRFRNGATVLFPSRFDGWIVGLAARHDLDPGLVSALIRAESGFSPHARSPKGAVGLMQLMPATAARLGVSNRYDPVSNLDGGMRYLRWLADRYQGDLVKVLAAYNAGEGAVDRYGGLPPYRETRGYVDRILGWLRAAERVPAV